MGGKVDFRIHMLERELVYFITIMHRFYFLVTVRNSSSYFMKADTELFGYWRIHLEQCKNNAQGKQFKSSKCEDLRLHSIANSRLNTTVNFT